jgi:hypothetical protein
VVGYPSGFMSKIDQDSSAYRYATKEWESLADAADMAPSTKAQMVAHVAAILKIAECMRADGSFPEPDARVASRHRSGLFVEDRLQLPAVRSRGEGLQRPTGAPKRGGSGGDMQQGG